MCLPVPVYECVCVCMHTYIYIYGGCDQGKAGKTYPKMLTVIVIKYWECE